MRLVHRPFFSQKKACFFLLIVLASRIEGIDISKLPSPADRQIEFQKDVLPLFEAHCFQCHSDHRPKGGFNLRHRHTALKGGEQSAILVGESEKSPLIHYVAHLEEDMEMPPIEKGERLSSDQIATLRAWIDQGALWKKGETILLSPTLAYLGVSGNEGTFREQHWRASEFAGGIDRMQFSDRFSNHLQIEMHARSLFETEDHHFELRLEKPELGFIELGYDSFRRFYNDLGGDYPDLGVPFLGKDLHLDVGNFWIDLGIDRPDLPSMVLGYEQRFRNGEKSMLHWGPIFPASPSLPGKGIFPSSKGIDETLHILKFDLAHNWRGWDVENAFRGEFFKISTMRTMADFVEAGNPLPERVSRVHETEDHFSGANLLRAEKAIKPWCLLSGGYLFSDLSAQSGFNLEAFLPSHQTSFQGDFSRALLLDRDSHVINVNSLFGPFKGLSAFVGIQNDWTRQSGQGDVFVFGSPTGLGSNLDQMTTEENFGIRYTKIKNTALYLDIKLQQRVMGQREDQHIEDGFDDANDFMRDTDARMDHKEYKMGMSYSPRHWISIETSYRRSLRQNQYDHIIDADLDNFTSIGNGYSAFIRARDTEMDAFEIKLTLKARRRIRTSIAYRLSATDFSLATDSLDLFDTIFPYSFAGNYDAHLYMSSITYQPKDRLSLSATSTISDIRTISSITDGDLLVPYSGSIYSFLGTSNYIISKTLDWATTYSFSQSDFSQINTGHNLPIGIDYDRHGILTGLTKKMRNTSQIRIQYGFFTYDEPTLSGAADYTAHGVFASWQRRF